MPELSSIVRVPQTRNEAREVVRLMGTLEGEIAQIKTEAAARVARLEAEHSAWGKAVKAFADSHRDEETDGTKTIDFGGDQKVYWKESSEADWDKEDEESILEQLRSKTSWRRFWNWKKTYSIDKDAVKRWPWIAQKVPQLRVVTTEKFYIQTGRTGKKRKAVTHQID